MITYRRALSLLAKYGLDKGRIDHSRKVSAFAFDLAKKIHSRHPSLDVDPEKVRVAALLHDIGRSREGDHETNSVDILTMEGHPDLAAVVMHGSMYEISALRGAPDESFLPKSLENKMVAYADARVKDRVVSLQERFGEVLSRRAMEKEKVKSVIMAMERYFTMEKELMDIVNK
jgi:putative nucleotidyltransferase with HDIG domain